MKILGVGCRLKMNAVMFVVTILRTNITKLMQSEKKSDIKAIQQRYVLLVCALAYCDEGVWMSVQFAERDCILYVVVVFNKGMGRGER